MMINFTQAFDSAWERMHVILFRPFDFGKWCAIGFCAFLAGLLEGGNGFNSSFNTNNFNNNDFTKYSSVQTPKFDFNQFNNNISHVVSGMQVGLVILLSVLIFAFILAFILLLYWLGARGEFMFLDNLVRNRGAVSWPWQNYKRQANSLFFFYLLIMLVSLLVFLPIVVVGIVMSIPLFQQHRWPIAGEIGGFVALGVVYFLVAIALGVLLFVFREFGVPIMFRQGLMARPAFWAAMNLVKLHTGSVALFVLLRIAIFIGVAVLSLVLCCLTIPCCCLSQWPYIGTVLLLPVLVYVRCFTLDCLAQFGPEYNVWTVDVPPAGVTAVPPFNPPLPPG